jgi:excisionase family DNA binding protein
MTEEISPSQVAKRVGASTRSVQRWIVAGRLPARRVGGRWRVAIDALDAFGADTNRPGRSRASSAPIRTLFIANRGEIVNRIARTCRELGIRAVAPGTEGPSAVDLLDGDALVDAARAAGADAIHPGFGFLAENADFAERTIVAGLQWVGPPPEAIRLMGDKAAARRLASSLGVAVLPGYDGDDQSDRAITKAAGTIGYPLLVKPAAGGGGKGMRVVRDPDRLIDALVSARREALAAFDDGRLILERLVEGARHVEVQVLFDAAGNGIALGERDCSIQRRHQKVLEETPLPGADARLRRKLGDAALTLARAVGYVSAGTCEFLLDQRGEFAFIEMNTRLQVEHPVTELVTGRDLVADQLRIAGGGVLDASPPVVTNGHAVEVRLYAEDADAGFLPATGRIEALHWPIGDGIRIDSGIEIGMDIGGRFDPMLAKVIAWGSDRAAALDRLSAALDATLVLGVVTNLRFLRWLVRQPVVIDGEARTDTLDRIWPPDDWADRTAIPDEAWELAADKLVLRDDEGERPWEGGWRLNGTPVLRVATEDQERAVTVGSASPTVGAAPSSMAAVIVDDVVHLDLAGRSAAFRLAPPPDVERTVGAALRHGTSTGGPSQVTAPMPGSVLGVHVQTGQAVDIGDPLVTLEAMKMEHVVAATVAGRVGDVLARVADQVSRGQVLVVIDS